MLDNFNTESPIVLSFCTIVKNERENLARCLESVKPYVDEIIVVDTGSEDNTIEIARKHGAKIFFFQWCDDFALAKNYAINQAKGEWILFLDADEELIVAPDFSIKNFVYKFMNKIETLVFNINLIDFYHSNLLSSVEMPRLFRNLESLQYVGAFHEKITYQNHDLLESHIGNLNSLHIMHYGYSSENLRSKAVLRIQLLETLTLKDNNLMLMLTLEGMYEVSNQFDKIEACHQKVYDYLLDYLLSGNPPEDLRTVATWLFILGNKLLKVQDYDASIIIMQRGLEWFPSFPPLIYLSGEILINLGFYLGAIPYYENCLTLNSQGSYNRSEPFDLNYLSTYPAYRIGCAYAELQQWQKAKEYMMLSLDFNPQYLPAKEAIQRVLEELNKSS